MITGEELEKNPYLELITDSQDLDWLCEYYPFIPREDITGAMILVDDGDIREAYITEYSAPWDTDAGFVPLSYYMPEINFSEMAVV